MAAFADSEKLRTLFEQNRSMLRMILEKRQRMP